MMARDTKGVQAKQSRRWVVLRWWIYRPWHTVCQCLEIIMSPTAMCFDDVGMSNKHINNKIMEKKAFDLDAKCC